MNGAGDLASVAMLLGDATRARILMELMDGRAWTATELALAGGVSPSTASSHLARLTKAGLLLARHQGRHRYFRIASPDVALAIEGLTRLSAPVGTRVAGPGDPALRRARVCYDHLAGEAGVRLFRRLRETGLITGDEDSPRLSPDGDAWCRRTNIDVIALRAGRRPLCRACLDWSERRLHLSGALGAAILDRLLAHGAVRRERGSRALILSSRGERFVEGLTLDGQGLSARQR